MTLPGNIALDAGSANPSDLPCVETRHVEVRAGLFAELVVSWSGVDATEPELVFFNGGLAGYPYLGHKCNECCRIISFALEKGARIADLFGQSLGPNSTALEDEVFRAIVKGLLPPPQWLTTPPPGQPDPSDEKAAAPKDGAGAGGLPNPVLPLHIHGGAPPDGPEKPGRSGTTDSKDT